MDKKQYEHAIKQTRDERMAWWRSARFGMFIHFGLYSVLGDHEWAKGNQNYVAEQYDQLAEQFYVSEAAIYQWIALAKQAGMKYVVLTTRHHEGFSLWDSSINAFNSMRYGKGIDVVAVFVKACNEAGLKVGLYFSLMDWHHEAAGTCADDEQERQRFLDYIQGMLRELMTHYGRIDILWYDIPRPMLSFEDWDSLSMNQMVRQLQPEIIINNRSRLAEDFGTPEERIVADQTRDWEACMTLNGLSWGYVDSDYLPFYNYSAQQIIQMLGKTIAQGGNLLLNVSPNGQGIIDETVTETLSKVGTWLQMNGEAVYLPKRKSVIYRSNDLCLATETHDTAYIWNFIWPKWRPLRLGGQFSRLLAVTHLATGKPIDFVQDEYGIELKLHDGQPLDQLLGITVFKLVFEESIHYQRATRYPQLLQGNSF